MSPSGRLRIGAIGAAAVVPMALTGPAGRVAEVDVAAVAARDPARATSFAVKHGIPRVARSYAELLADPDIDAVYIPLPNSLHAEWTAKALRAGKHVLCEKPFTSNLAEAQDVARLARETHRVVSEGFAYRYHPLHRRVQEILAQGEIGRVLRIEAEFCYANPFTNNIRFNLGLAGGATMDAGCYPVSLVRSIAGSEPKVVSAEAVELTPGIDRKMTAELEFADGVTGRIACAMLSPTLFRARLLVTGDRGSLRVINPYHPHWFHRLTVHGTKGARREHVPGDNVYAYQLRAFAAAVRGEGGLTTGPEDAVGNMAVIDAIYRRAGMAPRGTQPAP